MIVSMCSQGTFIYFLNTTSAQIIFVPDLDRLAQPHPDTRALNIYITLKF